MNWSEQQRWIAWYESALSLVPDAELTGDGWNVAEEKACEIIAAYLLIPERFLGQIAGYSHAAELFDVEEWIIRWRLALSLVAKWRDVLGVGG